MTDEAREPPPRARLAAQPVALDSACWLEYLADTDRAGLYAEVLERTAELVVPVLTIYEVHKKILREAGRDAATQVAALMQQGRVIGIDPPLALAASAHPLPLADSLIYEAARRAGAVLWTQDAHFAALPGVRHFPKPAV